MKYFVIFLILIALFMVATNSVYAQCAYDPSNPHAPCDDTHEILILNLHQAQIENIDGKLFRVIGPFTLQAQSNDTIRLGNVEFSYPYFPVPHIPGGVQSVNISFKDGIKENIGTVGPPNPFLEFTEHNNPKAGVRRNSDGTFNFLLSIENQSISPLTQFEVGIPFDEIQCKDSLVLIQKYDDSPACVKPETKQKLIERGWVKTGLPETFTLTVSNQSIDKDSVDILVKIDGNVVIDSIFETGSQHNYYDYGFLLTNGTHTLYAKSEEGQAELEQTFVIYGKRWGYLSYHYDKENENPRLKLIVNDKAFAFL